MPRRRPAGPGPRASHRTPPVPGRPRSPRGFCWISAGVPPAIDLAEVQHRHRLAEAHHQLHVVLDQQHGQAELAAAPGSAPRASAFSSGSCRRPARPAAAASGAVARARAISSRRWSPYGRIRPGRRRRSAEAHALQQRPASSRIPLLAGEARRAEHGADRPRAAARRASPPARCPAPSSRANSRMFWKVRAMPSCATWWRQRRSSAASSRTSPAGGRVDAGDDVEDRGLAGAVGADQPDQLARLQHQVQVAQRPQAAEVAGDVPALKQSHWPAPLRGRRPGTPSG